MTYRNTPRILEEIVLSKRQEVSLLKTKIPISKLEEMIDSSNPPMNLSGAMMGDSIRIVAEVKKASPTKGLLTNDFDPVKLASIYADNGAAAISVLTNSTHFQGSINDLHLVQKSMHPRKIPVLRKEFIFDEYQVYETRAYGADAILLIVAILSPKELRTLLELASSFWMHSLVEVHNEEELKIALGAGAEIIGINNRDLNTFQTSIQTTERLAPLVPKDKVIISESGINNSKDVLRIKKSGAHGILVGEALITASNPGEKIRELL